MQLYSMEGLPLQKYKNKYVIHSNELSEWMVYKEQEERKRQKQMLISSCIWNSNFINNDCRIISCIFLIQYIYIK